MVTLTQQQKNSIDKVINDGSACKALETHLQGYEKDGYFEAWPRMGYYSVFARLNIGFNNDYRLTEVLMETLEERGLVIKYKRKEVGSLIRYRAGSFDGCIPADYLVSETSKMNLDNAQINELERLLNKVGRSLDTDLPSVPQPTDQEMENALLSMVLEVIRSKPLHFHQKYLDQLAAQGTPASLNRKDFHTFAEKILTP